MDSLDCKLAGNLTLHGEASTLIIVEEKQGQTLGFLKLGQLVTDLTVSIIYTSSALGV